MVRSKAHFPLSLVKSSTDSSNNIVLKPAEFQKRWSQLIIECKPSVEERLQSPFLTGQECHELLLASAVLLRFKERPSFSKALDFLRESGDPIGQAVARLLEPPINYLDKLHQLTLDVATDGFDPFTLLMDLTQFSQGKQTKGVYYTPHPVAKKVAMLARDQLARQQVDVLSLQILEPAVGAGVFVHAWVDASQSHSEPIATITRSLSNWTCVDISPAAIVIAQALILDRVIGEEHANIRLPMFIAADTLSCTPHSIYAKLGATHIDEKWVKNELRLNKYQLVIGNPPFGTLTNRTDPWISKLLHGELDEDKSSRSYFEADGKPIKERKTWLHDDYVKFLRFSQWHAERNTTGTLALVLNSGFLTNLSFRGLRYHLLDTLRLLDIVDFGGDTRNQANLEDENIFQIETGVAALVGTTCSECSHADLPKGKYRSITKLSGTRQSKLRWSAGESHPPGLVVNTKSIETLPPGYRLDFSTSSSASLEYAAGWSLAEIFAQYWSAPVTARDHLVIDFTRERLVDKIRRFLDPAKSDEQIRSEFFPNPRSSRYPAGDSRSWKLGEARRRLRQSDWLSQILTCDYRPFDTRYILWNEAMIDWPRRELFEAMQLPGNHCLISRRQAPPGADYSYFWSSSGVPIDGIVRNDNRGNEYCFPLFIQFGKQTKSNLSDRFTNHLTDKWDQQSVDSQSVFDWLNAQFHSTEYRTRFRSELGYDFPKAFVPRSIQKAEKLATLGQRIRQLQATVLMPPEVDEKKPIGTSESDKTVAGYRKPIFENDHIWLGPEIKIPLSEEIWNLKIGSHQIIRKFCGYRVKADYMTSLEPILNKLIEQAREFREVCKDVDKLIVSYGGFRQTFDLEGKHRC